MDPKLEYAHEKYQLSIPSKIDGSDVKHWAKVD
jgi:hypothetical protein